MKKYFFIFLLFISLDVFASGGTLKQNSIIECNGQYYGNHGSPIHWHKAKKVNDKWVSDGEEVSIPACYIKPINEREEVKFSKCVDGDTAKFIIGNEEKTVRFLAINTPESGGLKEEELFGKEASEYTCTALKKAQKIVLEYDSNSDKEDKYGRILAFVFVDDILLEKDLISRGYAQVAYIYGDYNYLDELKEEEAKAKENQVGIWSEEINADIKEESEKNEKLEIENILSWLFTIFVKWISKIFDLS